MDTTFKDFLFKNQRDRITLWLALIAIMIQFGIFKYLYPFASYIHGDSFSYLYAAYQNMNINTYMVGYSRFLRLFSVFSQSDLALTAFQYLLIQCSCLFFLFTLFYFYKPGRGVQVILLVFLVFNPLFLHLANLISSDGFFLALSMTWFSILLWIIHRPSIRLILWHTLLVYIAFTVRYNALIYPFIAGIAFWLSRQPLKRKLTGFAAGILVVGCFILYTGNKYKTLTGTWQYSPFSGWQMINNAMYTYRYIDSTKRKPVPAKFRQLDNAIRNYFDSTRNLNKHPEEALRASTIYMWDMNHSPLYKYRDGLFKKDSTATEQKRWASVGPLFKEYGTFIIRQYPWEFAKYFLWPNAGKYYAPPVEFLEGYNSGKDSVMDIAQVWFQYKTRKVHTRMKDLKVYILDFFPILAGTMNVVFLCSLICFFVLREFNGNTPFRKAILLASSVWLINAGFTIFASSAALRFQSFPILLVTIFSSLLLDWLAKMARSPSVSTGKNYRTIKLARVERIAE